MNISEIFCIIEVYDDYEICGGSAELFYLCREDAEKAFNRDKTDPMNLFAVELRHADISCNGCLIPGSLIERWECHD